MELYLCPNISRREDAYALLAWSVRRRWGMDRLPDLARSEQGKPFFPAFPQYHFNLSHSSSLTLCALDELPVGADIEVIRPHHPNLARRICSAEELAWLEGQKDTLSALCQLWTRKEALVKYRGTGLNMPLREICVPLPPAGEVNSLFFHTIGTKAWCACVCGHTEPAPLITVRWEEICF